MRALKPVRDAHQARSARRDKSHHREPSGLTETTPDMPPPRGTPFARGHTGRISADSTAVDIRDPYVTPTHWPRPSSLIGA
jgi:hypothetical protein